MDRETIDDCFRQWLAYKPNKKKDWPVLRDIYLQELGKYNVNLLREALGRLLTSSQYFPDISEITKEIRAIQGNKGGGSTKSSAEREQELNGLVITAYRLLEHKLGSEFHGHDFHVAKPEGIPPGMENIVDAAIKRFYNTDRQNYLYGTLGKWVVDYYADNAREAA